MLSLCFEGSRSRLAPQVANGPATNRGSVPSRWVRSRWAQVACVAALLGVVGCGEDDDGDGDGTVTLADSGALTPLTTEIGIPTTVAVANGIAWVVESQFDHYAPLGGTGTPSSFRLIGVPLDANGGAALEIPLPDNFFPEGITATRGGRLFVGSFDTGEIYTVPADGDTATLFSAALPANTVGMTMGNDNATLWVCNSNLATGASMVVGLALQDGSTVGTHVLGTEGTFCNDLVMSPDGALWITDTIGGRIFRVPSEDVAGDADATVWLQDDLLTPPEANTFGVNGIALLNGQLFLVVTDRRLLVTIDPSLPNPTGADLRTVALSNAGATADLVRPDGITAMPGSSTDLLLVENGLGQPEGQGKIVDLVRIDRQ